MVAVVAPRKNGDSDESQSLGVAGVWLGLGLVIVIAGIALNDVFILVAGVLVVIYAVLVGWPLLMSPDD